MHNLSFLFGVLALAWCVGFLTAAMGNIWLPSRFRVPPFRHAVETMAVAGIVSLFVLAVMYF